MEGRILCETEREGEKKDDNVDKVVTFYLSTETTENPRKLHLWLACDLLLPLHRQPLSLKRSEMKILWKDWKYSDETQSGVKKKLVVNSSQKFVSHSMNSRCRSSSEQVEMLRWGKSFKELSWIYELLLLLQKSSSTVKIQRIIHRDPPSMKTLACSTESFNLKLFDTSLPFSTNERLYAILLNLILPPPLSSSSLQDFVNLKLKPFIFLSCNMKHTAEERERCVRRQTKLKSSKCPQYFDYSSTGGSHIRFSVYLHCEYNDCVDSSNPPTGSEKFEKYWHHNMLFCVVVYAGERNLINATELFFSGIETRIR